MFAGGSVIVGRYWRRRLVFRFRLDYLVAVTLGDIDESCVDVDFRGAAWVQRCLPCWD